MVGSRRASVAGGVIAAALVILGSGPAAHAARLENWSYMDETLIPWRAYGRGAFNEATQTGKPLFVFVYADWCPWCQKLETEALETAPISGRLEREFIPVAVDYDRQPKLSKQLGTRLVPTVIVITPDRRKLLRFFGFLEAAALADTLDRTLAKWRAGELPEEPEEFGREELCCPLEAPREEKGRNEN